MIDGAVQRTVRNGNVELAVVEAGDPARPAIVLVHGYPDTKELWDRVAARLAGRFHVIAYDVRGAGRSSAPRGPAAYDFERLGEDLERVIDELAPGRRVHLVGHDWGGIAGWEFAGSARFERRLASLTSIAGPSLDQVGSSLQELLRGGRLLRLAAELRRSWYIGAMWTPGAPTLAWHAVAREPRWRWWLRNVERVRTDERYPSPTLSADGVHGSNLYRRNIPRRLLRPRVDAAARIPVQLIVPSGDHFISRGYYARAAAAAPALRRRTVAGSHWAPRAHPELIASWVTEFVERLEAGSPPAARAPWVRGGGAEQLRGRLALVTGAGSGIGRATALALAERGARLLLVDRDRPAVEEVARHMHGAHALGCDVADGEAMERLVEFVLGEHGVPDVVVNNAGIGVAGPFLATGFADWRRVLDVNVMGVVHGCRLFAAAMIERGEGGQIVNTASAAAFQPTKELPAYAASKAAVLMLSRCLRAELAPSEIGVTAVCPGIVATNITRSTRYMGREDDDQQRLRDYVTAIYERRNFTARQVADEIVQAIALDRPVAVVTPEAKVMYALSRLAPRLLQRVAAIEALPV